MLLELGFGDHAFLDTELGYGIITQRLIQRQLRFRPVPSGGGLFDESGNLIGITTFMVSEGQSLNFAIATEDYLR